MSTTLSHPTREENKELERLHEAYCERIGSAERLDENHLHKAADRVRASAEILWEKYKEARERIEAAAEPPARPLVTRKNSAELARITNRRNNDYSLKYRSALLKMERERNRPAQADDPFTQKGGRF